MRKTLTFLLPAVLALLPAVALAGPFSTIPANWSASICAYMPCTGMGFGALGLRGYLIAKGIVALQVGFVAVAVFYLFTAARWMVMFPEDDQMVKQGRTTFVYTITGAAVVSVASWIAKAFVPGPEGTAGDIVNVAPLNDSFRNVLTYFGAVISVLLVVNIVLQGVRLVVSQGESDQTDKARKRLIQGFIGVGLTMLAGVITNSVNPQAGSSSNLAKEIAGVANYLMTILGFMAVVTLILAGVFLIVSVNDSLKEKAKTIVKTAVMALVAVIVSYALVHTVIYFN